MTTVGYGDMTYDVLIFIFSSIFSFSLFFFIIYFYRYKFGSEFFILFWFFISNHTRSDSAVFYLFIFLTFLKQNLTIFEIVEINGNHSSIELIFLIKFSGNNI